MPHEGKGEKAGKGHYSDAADLDQEHDDDMSGVCESRGDIYGGESGYTDGCGRYEQSVDEVNAMYRRIRQHQQA